MVFDFWDEIHIPQGMWKCLVHLLASTLPSAVYAHGFGPPAILIWSQNCPKVAELGLFRSEICYWRRHMARTWAKKNYLSSYDLKTVSRSCLSDAKYIFFHIFYEYGQVGSLLIRINKNISLDVCYKQPLLCSHVLR